MADTDAPDDVLRPAPPRRPVDHLRGILDQHGVTPGRAVAVAIVVVIAAIGGWWLLKPPPAPIESSLPRASSGSSYSSSYSSTTGASAATVSATGVGPPSTAATALVVDAAGAVVRPGLYRLRLGARVVDAIDAAGGLASGADSQRLNLAAPLTDGERVYVLRVGEAAAPPVEGGDEPPAAGPTGGPAADTTVPTPVDINTATADQLDALPGVGPSTAQAIIAYRTQHGPFGTVDDLLNVHGIGPAKLALLKPQAHV